VKHEKQQTGTRFQGRRKAHATVLCNETWFSDNPPDLGKSFSRAKTNKRHKTTTQILERAAKKAAKNGQQQLVKSFSQLNKELQKCRPNKRCGSLACPRCARAFQKAKVSAQRELITKESKKRTKKKLVFVTIIPKRFTYQPDQFHKIDVRKANRWFKDVIKAAGTRMILGSVDLGWEKRRGKHYLQLHWHLVMWTKNLQKLQKKLKSIFGKTRKYERAIDVREAKDLGVLAYMNKGIKLPELLRNNRRNVAELLLVLDKTEPMDLLVLGKVRLSAQYGALAFRPIRLIERGARRMSSYRENGKN
jgi:hypothetical protein